MTFHLTVSRCAVGAAMLLGSLTVLLLPGRSAAVDGSVRRTDAISPPPGANATSRRESDDTQRRLREGTVINDRSGVFRQDGDGAIFLTDDGWELGGLPNLNLERVVRALKSAEESVELRWSVSGTVTEFSGRNFLLITRAIYKSAASPPPPEQLIN